MLAENERADDRGKDVAEYVFDRMGVDGSEANRGRPLVVLLVDVLVEPGTVEEAAETGRNKMRWGEIEYTLPNANTFILFSDAQIQIRRNFILSNINTVS